MKSKASKYYPALRKFQKLNNKDKKKILANCPNHFINCISEICLNCVHGNLPIDQKHKNLLKKDFKYIKAVSNRRVPLYLRKKVLSQRGGFLPIILKFALPIIASFIFDKLANKPKSK